MELILDHVMFPVYYNNPFLEVIEDIWRERELGKVFAEPQNESFKGVYLSSKSFYIEYLSNTKSEPYWSNTVYIVLPKTYWGYYEAPDLMTEHFLTPTFGCGYCIVNPDYPYLNSVVSRDEVHDGLTVLISSALEKELLRLGGMNWTLPASGKLRVHESLVHPYDMAIIDENSKLVAPLLQANPLLREFL
jgi:hypothetical protein